MMLTQYTIQFNMAIRQGTTALSGVYLGTTNSTGIPTAWAWTFPGGTPATSTLQNPTVTYNTAGTYDVTLNASNAVGGDINTKVGYVNAIAAAISLVDLQLYFQFNGTTIDDSGNSNTTTQNSTNFGAGKFGQAAVINGIEANTTALTPVTLTSGSTTIPINTWTHVAATFDTTNGSKLYIDGVLVGTQPTLTQNNNTSCRVNIGSAGTPTYVAAPLDGSIDEAILYSRALTAGEISILAAGTQPLL